MAVLYRHIRLDSNQPFYIGIGQDEKRAYELINRNKHWHGIVNKAGYKVQIMLDDLSWEEACEKECEFIQLYGRADLGLGTLVNMTDGGDGTPGRKGAMKDKNHSEETIAKIGAALRGIPKSEETRTKMSSAAKGKVISEETKAKMVATRKANGSYKRSKEAIEKGISTRKANGTDKHSEETKVKRNAAIKAYWAKKKMEVK